MNKATLLFLCVFGAAAAPEAALAQAHICAYANDDLTAPSGLNNLPNTVDGYNISGGSATYLPPVTTTRGFGVGGGYFAGGRGGVHVINNNLYIENDYSRTIAHLVINPANCTLTYDRDYVDGDLVSSKLGDPLAVAPNGKYLYVANNGNYFSTGTANIQMMKVRPNGSLSPATPQSIPVADYVAQLAISANGRVLVASMPDLHEVCAYTIAANGTLSASPNCQNMGGYATGVDISANGKCVFVGENTPPGESATVAAAPLAGGTLGQFTEYNGNLGGGQNGNDVAVDATGQFLFISNNYSNQITTAKIGRACTLSQGTISPTGGKQGQDYPAQIAVAGSTVVVGNFNLTGVMTEPSMGIYTAQPDGTLQSLTGGSALHALTTVQIASPLSVVVAAEPQ